MNARFVFAAAIFTLIFMAVPAFSMFKDEQPATDNVSLDFGIVSIAGVGGVFALIKKEKMFMKRHTFRFEKIKKELREDDDE